MILLDIEDNWYFFLVFAGGFLGIAGIVLFLESRRDHDDILQLNPLIVLRNILLNQIGFYMVYLLVTFTLDITANEIFWWTQVFAAIETSFVTKRGLITSLSLIVSLASTCLATAATIQTYRSMLDYCFTVFVIHFIIVSIVGAEFPVYGAWWVGCGVGLILFMILSERLSYHLETMSYQSRLLEPAYKSRKSKKEETELPTISESDEHLTTSSSYPSSQSKDKEDEEKPKGKPKGQSDGEESSNSQDAGDSSKESQPSKETEEGSGGNKTDGTGRIKQGEEKEKEKEKEKKNGVKKRKNQEEKALKEDGNSTEEEVPLSNRRGNRGSSSPKSDKKIPSSVKSLPLKEHETGKKDKLKNAKMRDVEKKRSKNCRINKIGK